MALLILSIVAVGLLASLSTAAKAYRFADVVTKAQRLAENQMEYIKNQDYNTTNGTYQMISESDIPDGYTIYGYDDSDPTLFGWLWDPQIDNFSTGNNTNLHKIRVIVKYDGKERITIENFKVNR